jgi:hypothetical protein
MDRDTERAWNDLRTIFMILRVSNFGHGTAAPGCGPQDEAWRNLDAGPTGNLSYEMALALRYTFKLS